ncbi:MAG: hypothetical protein ACKVU1_18500 [bacterium]
MFTVVSLAVSAARHAIARARFAAAPAFATAVALAAGLCACGQQRAANDGVPATARIVSDTGMVAFDDSTAEFPRVQFRDGQLSLNTRCIVRQVKLNRRMPPIYVNGQPIGFC